MSAKPLLRAPYIRGELGPTRNLGTILNLIFAVLFVLMPLSFIGATVFSIPTQPVFVGIWLIASLLILWMEALAHVDTKLTGFHLLALCMGLVGVPGIVMLRGNLLFLLMAFGYTLVLLIRNGADFIVFPRAIASLRRPMVHIMKNWLLVGASIVVFLTIAKYGSSGFSVFKTTRGAFDDWLHPNNAAIYGGVLILTSMLSNHLNAIVRWFLSGAGLYVILMTQSRGALVATFLAAIVLFALDFYRNPRRYTFIAIGGGFAVVLTGLLFGQSIMQIGAVENMIERTQRTDPTAGRIEAFNRAIDLWQDSPLFGYGFQAPVQVDNVIASFLLQIGLVGVLLNILFLGLILYRALQAYFRRPTHEIFDAGRTVLVFGVFIMLRSLVEFAHIFQITDLFANAFCILAGLLFEPTNQAKITGRKLLRANTLFARPGQPTFGKD